MAAQDEQFDPSNILDQGSEDQDASNESSTGGAGGGEQTPEEAPPGMDSGDINEASKGGGPDELPKENQALSGEHQEEGVSTEEGGGEDPGEPQAVVPEDQPPSSHTIENHLGEEIVISTEALDYIEYLQNQLEAEKKEVERLNTQVKRLNRSSSIGRR